jgi:hypothetical protein
VNERKKRQKYCLERERSVGDVEILAGERERRGRNIAHV